MHEHVFGSTVVKSSSGLAHALGARDATNVDALPHKLSLANVKDNVWYTNHNCVDVALVQHSI